MHTKTGRERRFDFANEVGAGSPEARWLFGLLIELGERFSDQVDHLPPEVLNAAPAGSYLSPARIILHTVQSELGRMKLVLPGFADPPYLALVERAGSENFATLETEAVDSLGVLKAHLAFRRELFQRCPSHPGFLDEPLDHPTFPDRRAVVGHLIWHWSFHSGHLGAVTLELGHDYTWTSATYGATMKDKWR